MHKACLVFDISHSTLNALAFSQSYAVLYQDVQAKKPIKDEDGYGCENISEIETWVKETLAKVKADKNIDIIAVNFTAYAGAVVHLDGERKPVTEVYDHLRPLGYKTRQAFLEKHGEEDMLKAELQLSELSFESPALQLYWLKVNKPTIFKKVKSSLSISQYLSSLYSGICHTEYTMVGCYSASWDFDQKGYHKWLKAEGLTSFDLPIVAPPKCTQTDLAVGSSIYNKVAELQIFLATTDEQFILLSTGAWTTCINPFNGSKASVEDLKHDCFNILDTEGKALKMARLFSGNEHSRQIEHLATHFGLSSDFYLGVKFDHEIIKKLRSEITQVTPEATELGGMLDCPFMERNLNTFQCVEDAYHQFIMDLIAQQIASIKLTYDHQSNRIIYVEGGLAKNEVFMQLLSEAFHDKLVYKVDFEHTACMGAAMVISDCWGAGKLNKELLQIQRIT